MGNFLLNSCKNAGGTCPDGWFAIGGGYCREIKSDFYSGCLYDNDPGAAKILKENGYKVPICYQFGKETIPMK